VWHVGLVVCSTGCDPVHTLKTASMLLLKSALSRVSEHCTALHVSPFVAEMSSGRMEYALGDVVLGHSSSRPAVNATFALVLVIQLMLALFLLSPDKTYGSI
jgi:hypothetical protein